MSSFVRVRAVDGPKHEFYAASGEVEANPDLYEVLDPEPVATPGEVVYVTTKPKKANVRLVGDLTAYKTAMDEARRKTEPEIGDASVE